MISIRSLLRIAFWSAGLFALVMATLPESSQDAGESTDKLYHIVAFVTLSLLSSAAYPRVRLWILALGLGGFGLVIEIVQSVPALNRDADMADLLADLAAIGGTLILVYIARSSSRLRSRSGAAPPRLGEAARKRL